MREFCLMVIYNATVHVNESGNVIGVFAAALDVTNTLRGEQGAIVP